MARFPVNPTFAKAAFLQDIKDPGRMGARPPPPAPPQSVTDVPAHLNAGASAHKLYATGDGMARGAAVGLLAEVQPRADAPPASSPYGPVAPAWARGHRRLIRAWACLRALRWVLRDCWRGFIAHVS